MWVYKVILGRESAPGWEGVPESVFTYADPAKAGRALALLRETADLIGDEDPGLAPRVRLAVELMPRLRSWLAVELRELLIDASLSVVWRAVLSRVAHARARSRAACGRVGRRIRKTMRRVGGPRRRPRSPTGLITSAEGGPEASLHALCPPWGDVTPRL